ncbi:unnamed protein product [Acidithrix sp. C25]|nr:unnamed protein product [Acidithrix sp. C25]
MDNGNQDISRAPLPTARTIALRTNLFYQGWRFVVFNLKMLGMVLKGHD